MSESKKGKPNQEELDRIAVLMLTKRYSGTELASILGRSKGSIMGIIFRTPRLKQIGLPHRPPKMAKKPKWDQIIVQEPMMTGPVPMIQLKDTHCKFPLWGHHEVVGSMGLFCAEARLPNSSYCANHHKLCITLPYQHTKPVRLRIRH